MRSTHIVAGRKSTESFSITVYNKLPASQSLGCETHIKIKGGTCKKVPSD